MADTNELVIRLTLDRSIAEAEAEAFHKAEKARIARTLTDAEVAEKARSAFINRENAQRVQAAAAASKTTIEQAKETAEAEKKLAKDAADAKKRADKQAAKAKADAAKEANAAIAAADKVMSDILMADLKALVAADKDAAKARKADAAEVAAVIRRVEAETAADKRQWGRRELTDYEVNDRARTAIIRRGNQDRVREIVSATELANAAEKSILEVARDSWRSKIGLAGDAGLAVASVSVAMTGLRAGTAILDGLTEQWKGMAAVAMDAAKAATAYGVANLELAGFADTPGQTVAQQQKTAGLVAASGVSMQEATNLRRSAEAGAYAILDKPGKDGLMSRDEFEKAQEVAAKWASASGGGAADYGKAVAMIPSLEGRRMTAAEVEGDLVRMDKLATIGGFETPSDFIKQVQGVSGYIKSGVVSSKVAQGLTAIAAKTSPGEAGTIVEQMMTALSAGALMDRGINVPDEMKAQMQTSAAWFKDIGITRNMLPEEALPKIDEALAKLPAGTNKDQFLLEHGVTNQKSRQGFLMFHGEKPTWDKEVMPILNAAIPAGTVDDVWGKHIQNDPVGRDRIAEASGDLATNIAGQRMQGLRSLMLEEYNRKKSAGLAAGPFEEYAAEDSYLDWGRMWKGTTAGSLMEPVARRVVAEMGRLNLSTDLGSDSDGTRSDVYRELTGPGGQQYKAGIIDRVTSQVRGAGGDATFGGASGLSLLTQETAAQRRVLERIEQNTRAQQQSAPGRPRMPAPRP